MSTGAESSGRLRVLTGAVAGRRRRAAVLLGVLFFLALAAAALILAGPASHRESLVAVLRATKAIRAGSAITAGELGVTYVHFQDPGVVQTLARPSNESTLVGEVAAVSIPAGSLIPTGLGNPQSSSGMWDANLPVKRMPSGLHAGDHVALIVETSQSGQPIDFVLMQDVQVLSVGSGSADLWLPAKVVAQVEWDGSHGDIVLVGMPAGGVQQNLPAGGGS